MKKISVIVPVFNQEKYLRRCIDSIVNQTYRDLDIILVDDGSTDRCGEICDEYQANDRRISVIHKKNGGQSSARNVGLDLAHGDFIAFVDSDDWLVDDIYEQCVAIAESDNCDVVDFKCRLTKGEQCSNTKNVSIEKNLICGEHILFDYLLRGQSESSPFSVCRKLYRKHLFRNVRFPDNKINEDIATNYRVLMECKILVHINKIGYYYYQDDLSTTRYPLRKRDFDLLDASYDLLILTKGNLELEYLAKVKLARSYFSLLAKVAYYGIDNALDQKAIIECLTSQLRKNYFLLIHSPISLNRKLCITLVCIDFRCLYIPVQLYRFIRR